MSEQPAFHAITALPMLFAAFDRVEDNAGGPGVDGETIEMFGASLRKNIRELHYALVSGRYRPQPLLRVHIQKSDGTQRALSIPAVRDRVVQTAVAMVLDPMLEPEFEDSSYGYRRGRSVQQAVRKILEYQRQGYRWVVDGDIAAFFDEIAQDRLLNLVASHVNEPLLLTLLKLWLEADVVEGVKRWRLTKGVPQGSPISPLLSNLYLDQMDETLEGAGRRFVRFADDFVILCRDRPAAEAALELTQQVLSEMQLRLNPDKTRITDFDRGFSFLGYEFVRSMAIPRSRRAAQHPNRKARPQRQASEAVSTSTAPETAFSSVLAATQAVSSLDESLGDLADDMQDLLSFKESTVCDSKEPPADNDPLMRTLYLMEQGNVLGKEDERFVIRKQDEIVREIPVIKVDQILIFGNVQVTTPALHLCLKEGIPILLLSSRGRYYGVVESPTPERIFLQRDQFARAGDAQFCLEVSREFVRGKILGTLLLLRRYERTHGAAMFGVASGALNRLSVQISGAKNLNSLRGIEGAAAAAYFAAVRGLLDTAWGFENRERQPPPDPVNAVLSYVYTLLFYNIYSIARAAGLNPHVGFLHPLRSGHPALISDLMEEFRAVIADAVVWPLFTRRTLKRDDFEAPDSEGGACRIGDLARRKITHAFEAKMNSVILNPRTGATSDYRRLMAYQAHLMARAIRGEEAYKAMVLK